MSARARRAAFTVVLSLAVAGSLSALPGASAGERPTEPAPLHRSGDASEIPGRYIVVLERDATRAEQASALRQAENGGGRVTAEYDAALTGFAAELSGEAVAALRRNPDVRYLEADAQVRAYATQSGAPWGLDRIDQDSLPLDGTYRYDRSGAGVTAYVVDTGIRKSHRQFGGRVLGGFTAVNDGRGTGDCNGHGTHVAGTVGSKRYGVAKAVTLRPVRVLNCRGFGSTSKLIAGVDWVTAHHKGSAPAVANMSLGGEPSWALDQAVQSSIADGVTYVAAAGNDSANACNYSPGRLSGAVTVGSTTRTDARSWFSNTGRCLDLFAPGSGITSTWHRSNTATKTVGGTSMAAPHVSGAVALLLQQAPGATPEQVSDALLAAATPGAVSGAGAGSPNLLLHSRGAPLPVTGNLLTNGGFEQGDLGWSATAAVITDEPGVAAHEGRWRAWMLGYGHSRTDSLRQTVTIPPSGGASLTFYLQVDTEEPSGSGAWDELDVAVSAEGATSVLATYSNSHATTGYVRRTLDLSAYAGQTVTLSFTATEDGALATQFLLDNVRLTTG